MKGEFGVALKTAGWTQGGPPRRKAMLAALTTGRWSVPLLQSPFISIRWPIRAKFRADIEAALDEPPQTTRARLRGEFIKRAKERKRDYTVDWVHLKLNDQAQRTVLCKDPFKSRDERVEKLIASL